MTEQTVELEDVAVEAETDLALLCNIDNKKHWIPKSVVHEDSEVSSDGGQVINPHGYKRATGSRHDTGFDA